MRKIGKFVFACCSSFLFFGYFFFYPFSEVESLEFALGSVWFLRKC
jgi:hypothetical protein